MAKRFLECSLEQPYLLPPDLQEWLPEGHLARFVADVSEQLDLNAIYNCYERGDGRGKAAYHPLMMTRLLLYAYALGVASSRAIEKATYDNLAFRYLSADQHPDHDTIAHFRQQHLEALGNLFAQALALCQRAGLVQLGVLAIDGTKIKAAASKRESMRLNTMREQEQRLEALVKQILQQAETTDAEEDMRWGKEGPADPLPPGLDRAQERLRRLREAKAALEEEAAQQLVAACTPSSARPHAKLQLHGSGFASDARWRNWCHSTGLQCADCGGPGEPHHCGRCCDATGTGPTTISSDDESRRKRTGGDAGDRSGGCRLLELLTDCGSSV